MKTPFDSGSALGAGIYMRCCGRPRSTWPRQPFPDNKPATSKPLLSRLVEVTHACSCISLPLSRVVGHRHISHHIHLAGRHIDDSLSDRCLLQVLLYTSKEAEAA